MQIFIDTNIFLDLILKREKYSEALSIFTAIEQKQFIGIVLDITILNIDYIAKKQTKDIREFLLLINKVFKVVGATNETILDALKVDNNDLEDNLQYISAKNTKCTLIVTNDKKFIKKNIRVFTSEEFCREYINAN